ncbi:hypothetical protein LOTGIDRAFT_175895 [Lottia gigantea]|uniref:Phospholipase A2-like domain-containing protein n=1 Tax=Lottia gigantea TaxID=225164 RepID=V3ZB42_LOTGI|nr:hypothetical protein LOTGIDRAFT_175895 [Lottia gigantea]ESO88223.1 hypothetical protein LOTGIDRAFT_175895 [Lottia gigantea]
MSLINVHPPKTYFGAGDIQKSLGSLPGFPWSKYPGEKHLPGHNYTGPGTRLDLRLDENDNPKPGEEPVNRVDAAALKHDILYRNKDVTFRHQADKQMIDELENIPNPTFKEKLQRALIELLRAKLKLDYCKGKNDYGDGGIIFGLYLAPKVKYNIVLTSDGVLKEKKTFKGYSNDKISVEDYVQLASGHDVSNEFNKPWEKSFTNGVVIPNDKQTKVFRSYLNNVKRKPPNSEGIMYPYNDKDEYNFDENYEFDDFDYLTIQEENEDCFK